MIRTHSSFYSPESDSIYRQIDQVIFHLETRFQPLSEALKTAITLYYLFTSRGHTAIPLDYPVNDLLKQTEWYPGRTGLSSVCSTHQIQGEIDRLNHQEIFPFVIDEGLFYSKRTQIMEQFISDYLNERISEQMEQDLNWLEEGELDSTFQTLFPDAEINSGPMQAAKLLLKNRFSILTGGPGTGKTTAAVSLILSWIRVQIKIGNRPHLETLPRISKPKIALAAPTGKAAARLVQSIAEKLECLEITDSERACIPTKALTLHRLLHPYQKNTVLPDPRNEEYLPYDLIVVDEASMMDLTLFYTLIRRLNPRASLLLIGDQYQLESVDSGAVFRDLCSIDTFSDRYRVTLTKNWRFDSESGIAKLSEKILTSSESFRSPNRNIDRDDPISDHRIKEQEDTPSSLFKDSHYDDIYLHEWDHEATHWERIYDSFSERYSSIRTAEATQMVQKWSEEIWLTPLRLTSFGSDYLNSMIQEKIVRNYSPYLEGGWFHGKPFIVTKNNYSIGVFNGDRGVCFQDNKGNLVLLIETSGQLQEYPLKTPLYTEPAWVLTVHKSQGSEFDRVHLILPEQTHPLLHRQLLYTAVTRARKEFILYGHSALLDQASCKDQVRFTNLQKYVKKRASF